MSNRLPVEINPFRLVDQRRQLSGYLPLQEMSRLSALTTDTEGDFRIVLDFERSATGLPMITGSIKGVVKLECQRCLAPTDIHLDESVEVVLIGSNRDPNPEEDGYDIWHVEDERLFMRDFVEDEILLSLPVIARHESCQPARPLVEATVDDELSESQPMDEEKENPFAVLKNWKKPE